MQVSPLILVNRHQLATKWRRLARSHEDQSIAPTSIQHFNGCRIGPSLVVVTSMVWCGSALISKRVMAAHNSCTALFHVY